ASARRRGAAFGSPPSPACSSMTPPPLAGEGREGGSIRVGAYEVFVGCNHLEPPLADFHKATVERAGAVTCRVPTFAAEFETPDMQAIRNRLARYDALGFLNVLHVVFHYALMIRQVRPALVHTWMDYCNVLA